MNHNYPALFIVVTAGAVLPAAAHAQLITPAEILAQVRTTHDSLENLAVTAHWEEYKDGTLMAIEDQQIAKDRFERIRVQSSHGAVGVPQKTTDHLYNGELTVKFDEDPEKDRLGQSVRADGAQDREHYKAAIINDGLGADGKGPHSRRNPFSFISQWTIDTLQDLLNTGGAVTATQAEGKEDVYVVRFHLSPEDDPQQIRHVVFVDGAKGWTISRHERHTKEGRLVAVANCEYTQDPNGNWLPSSGSWQNWWEAESEKHPAMEWRFKVQEIAYNDPQFDDRVFDISLPPGTYVTDNRHNVSYFVGDEAAVTTDLAELAQRAVAEEAATLRKLQRPSVDIGQIGTDGWLTRRSILVLVNVVAVAFVLFVWYWRRHA